MRDRSHVEGDPSRCSFSTLKVRDTRWCYEPKPYYSYPEKFWTASSEAHYIFDAARRLGSGNYADLGVFRGGSTVAMAWGLKVKGHKGTVYSVDGFGTIPNPNRGKDSNNKRLGSTLIPPIIEKYFKEELPEIGLKICAGDTSEWGRKLKGTEFNFVFVDADHSYAGCKADVEAWAPLVKSGGEMAFHDCHLNGVHQAIEELGPEWKLVDQYWSTKIFRKS